MRIHRFPSRLLVILSSLVLALISGAPAHGADGPRLGDSSSAFDAALGPAVLGQSWWYYKLPDGILARGATSASSLENVPQVLFLQRNWNPGDCADAAAAEAARRQYLPADAQKQWSSGFPAGGGSPAGTQVEGWYSGSLATRLAGSDIRDPGLILVTAEDEFGGDCTGTVRLTFDGAKVE